MSQEQRNPDPGERFREVVTEWERSIDAMANRVMGTDEFSRAMNQFQNLQLTVQKTFSDLMGRQLAAMNLPSREDLLRVGEAVHELDTRLTQVELKLEEIGRAAGVAGTRPKAGPPRTRKPPSQRGAEL